MKKFYKNPKMNISKFNTENVVTTSGIEGIKATVVSDTNTDILWSTIFGNAKDVTKVTF